MSLRKGVGRMPVITSYSIHYTKLYETRAERSSGRGTTPWSSAPAAFCRHPSSRTSAFRSTPSSGPRNRRKARCRAMTPDPGRKRMEPAPASRRDAVLAIFEKHRIAPATPFDEDHFLDFLLPHPKGNRITSYNVCYTKLLRYCPKNSGPSLRAAYTIKPNVMQRSTRCAIPNAAKLRRME